MPHVTATVIKMRLFVRHSQVYYDNFHITLSAGFQNRVLLFTSIAIAITKTANQNARENLPSSTTTIFPTKSHHKAFREAVPKLFLSATQILILNASRPMSQTTYDKNNQCMDDF